MGADRKGPLAAFVVVTVIAAVLLITSVRSQAASGIFGRPFPVTIHVAAPGAQLWGSASHHAGQAVHDGIVLAQKAVEPVESDDPVTVSADAAPDDLATSPAAHAQIRSHQVHGTPAPLGHHARVHHAPAGPAPAGDQPGTEPGDDSGDGPNDSSGGPGDDHADGRGDGHHGRGHSEDGDGHRGHHDGDGDTDGDDPADTGDTDTDSTDQGSTGTDSTDTDTEAPGQTDRGRHLGWAGHHRAHAHHAYGVHAHGRHAHTGR